MRVHMYGGTDIGLVRTSNQDNLYFNADFGIAIVSDGMGGHKGGEIASELVVNGIKDAFLSASQILVENMGLFLDDALGRINADILTRAKADHNLHGMGATVNFLMFAGGKAAIGHAGDSRTYLVRGVTLASGKKSYHMWPMTVDHNVGTFIERGILVEGRDFRPGTVNERIKARLTRGMGVVSDLKADLYTREILENDVYVTCSDGLHGFCEEIDILNTIVHGPISTAHERLIRLAKQKGAPDNVTIVVSVCSEEAEPLLKPAFAPPDHGSYLVRLAHGEVRGPFSANDIIRQWVTDKLPNNAEVAASNRRWVFLNHGQLLTETYPEFNHPKVREKLRALNPDSTIEFKQPREVLPPILSDSGQKRNFYIVVFLIFVIFILFIMLLSGKPVTPPQ